MVWTCPLLNSGIASVMALRGGRVIRAPPGRMGSRPSQEGLHAAFGSLALPPSITWGHNVPLQTTDPAGTLISAFLASWTGRNNFSSLQITWSQVLCYSSTNRLRCLQRPNDLPKITGGVYEMEPKPRNLGYQLLQYIPQNIYPHFIANCQAGWITYGILVPQN